MRNGTVYCVSVPLLAVIYMDFMTFFDLVYVLLVGYIIGYFIYRRYKHIKIVPFREKLISTIVVTYVGYIILTLAVAVMLEIISSQIVPQNLGYLAGMMWFLGYFLVQIIVIRKLLYRSWKKWMRVVMIVIGILMLANIVLMVDKQNQRVVEKNGNYDGFRSRCGVNQGWY